MLIDVYNIPINFFKVPIDKLVTKLPDKFGFKEFNPSQVAMLEGLESP